MPVAISSLTVTAQLDGQQYLDTAARIQAANEGIASSQEKVDAVAATTETRLNQTGGAYERVSRRIDDTYRTQQLYNKDLAAIQGVYDRNKISVEEYNRRIGQLNDYYKLNRTATNEAALSAGQMRFALTNLGFQLNDVVTSLASGINPLRTFAQQGGQFVQVFQQAGFGNLMRATGAAIASWITPTTAAVAGVTALGAAVTALVMHAQSNAEQVRQFGLILDNYGTSGRASGEGLQAVARHLQTIGVSAADANTMMEGLARNPILNPEFADKFAQIGVNIAAVFGVTAPAGMDMFNKAVAGGIDSVLKLAVQVNALTGAEAAHLQAMADQGRGALAMRLAIQALAAMNDRWTESLTTSQRATAALSTAWHDFVNAASDTTAIQIARGALVGLLQDMTAVISKKDELSRSQTTPASGAVTYGVGGALAGAGIGTLIAPGVGTLVGGVIGGFAGMATGYGIGLSNLNQPVATAPIPPPVSGSGNIINSPGATIQAAPNAGPYGGTPGGYQTGGVPGGIYGGTTGPYQQGGPPGGIYGGTAPAAPITGSRIAYTSGGSPADALADAMAMIGLTETGNAQEIRGFLRSGGADLDPRTIAWCAAFANAALARQGIAGTGSNIATSFLNWGTPVTGAPRAGDIVVIPRGAGPGQTGGHVGLATGLMPGGAIQYVAGNESNAVATGLVQPAQAVIRRAPDSTAAGMAAGTSTGTPPAYTLPNQQQIKDTTDATNRLAESQRQQLDVAQKQGIEQRAQIAYWGAYNRVLDISKDKVAADTAGQQAAAAARQVATVELQKQSQQQQIANDLAVRSAKAFGTDLAAGYRAAAEAQATLEVREGRAADVASRTQEILTTQAAQAIQNAAQQVAAGQQQVTAAENLAEATKLGAAAAHEQTLQNEVAAKSQDVLAKAEATRNPILIAQAKNLRDVLDAQVHATDAAERTASIYAQINARSNLIQVTELQTAMVGQAPETIAAAVAHLQEIQRLRDANEDLASKTAQDDLRSVDALSRANAQLAEAVRQQQRMDELFRSIGDTISNFLTQRIEDAFSGKKTEAWGTQIKQMFSQIVSQISSTTFIRPLLGSVFGGLGMGNLASQYGTLGNLFGGGGATGNQSVTLNINGSSFTATPTGGTGLLGNLFGGGSGGGGGGLLGNLFGGSGGGSSGIGSWFSGLGTKLGFATTVPAMSTSEIASFGKLIGIEPESLGFLGQASTIPGSVFGNLTLGGAFQGAGMGLGAGSLLASLLGGNQMYGSIGAGIGGLAGTLGAAAMGFGGPIGGILGGLIGGLGSLFGPPPTVGPNASANIWIHNGRAEVYNALADNGGSAGDARAMAQAVVNNFNRFLRQNKLTYSGEGYGGIGNFPSQGGYFSGIESMQQYGSNAAEAENALVLQLLRSGNILGMSPAFRQILNVSQATDISGLQQDVSFAATYDKIKNAADEAFASLDKLTQIGPFETAKNQIDQVFNEIRDKTEEFGLAMQPVDDAIAEATRRLNDDFTNALKSAGESILQALPGDATNVIGPFEQAQTALDQTFETFRNDAIALGRSLDDVNAKAEAATRRLNEDFSKALSTAAESALQSVPGEKSADAFLTARKQLDLIFATFASDAVALGRSLDDVNAAAESASQRLQRDFIVSVKATTNTASGQGFINDLQSVLDWHDQMTADARALGLAMNEVGEQVDVGNAALLQFNAILKERTAPELQAIAQAFKDSNPWLAQYAESLISTAPAASGATSETNKLADAFAAYANMLTSFNATIDSIAHSVPLNEGDIGPFEKAKNQLVQSFNQIAEAAKQAGQSTDAITNDFNVALEYLRTDFNAGIRQALEAIDSPLQAQIDIEKQAGAQRIREAQAVAGDIEAVNRLNAANLMAIWNQATSSLKDLRNSLTTGALSGLTPGQAVQAANDNFVGLLGQFNSGNTAVLADLASAGQSAITQSMAAYGNGPPTASLRATIISALDQVLSTRLFAAGTADTPPGWVMVGERGPEWLNQPGGATVLRNGVSPAGADNVALVSILQKIADLLSAGNQISATALSGILEETRKANVKPVVLVEPRRTAA